MTAPRAQEDRPRRAGRSVLAVAAGFLATFILTGATDQLLHVLGVYPPWGEPMRDPALNILALGYRVVFTVIGGWVTARLAPAAPMRHAVVLAVIGLVLGTLSAIVTIARYDLGPAWYPVAIVLTSVPAILIGARIHEARSHDSPQSPFTRGVS